MANGSQVLFALPVRILAYPIPPLKRVYDEMIRYTKGAVASLLGECTTLPMLCAHACCADKNLCTVLVCQLCAPTEFSFTFETGGPGAFTSEEIGNMVLRDEDGHFVSLNLPQRSVLITNHQVRSPSKVTSKYALS